MGRLGVAPGCRSAGPGCFTLPAALLQPPPDRSRPPCAGPHLQPLQRVQVAELHDLHGHGQLGAAQARDHLGVVHDAHKLLGRHLHHLRAGTGAGASARVGTTARQGAALRRGSTAVELPARPPSVQQRQRQQQRQQKRLRLAFSRSSAPPRPLTTSRLGSTWVGVEGGGWWVEGKVRGCVGLTRGPPLRAASMQVIRTAQRSAQAAAPRRRRRWPHPAWAACPGWPEGCPGLQAGRQAGGWDGR